MTLYTNLQTRYDMDKPWQRDYILSDMGKIWRTSKCRMIDCIKKAKTEQENMSLKLENIVSSAEWKAYVR